uniref:C2 domain-containing protein n=1 Tax=Aegilops tauschii subsp. strangulata TaxID=200361 RepID=A0A453FY83_AEGTS
GFPVPIPLPSPPAPTPAAPAPPAPAPPPAVPDPAPFDAPAAGGAPQGHGSGGHRRLGQAPEENVNWRRGDLRAYAVAYLDPSRRTATRPDDAGGCKPAWNERITLQLPPHLSPHDPSLLLSLDVFHSKPSDSPKPLVGSARSPLRDLLFPASPNPSSDSPASPIITLPLLRPSGRPQGKLRIRVALRERSPPPPEPQYPPPSSSPYYFPAPPPPTYSAPPQYGSDQYYRPSGYYSAPPPPPPSQYEYNTGPSAPVEYGRQYEQRGRTEGVTGQYDPRRTEGVTGQYEPKGRTEGVTGQGRTEGGTPSERYGLGAGLAVGAVAGAVGALAIDEGVKYKEEKAAERVGEKVAPAARDDYSEYRREY